MSYSLKVSRRELRFDKFITKLMTNNAESYPEQRGELVTPRPRFNFRPAVTRLPIFRAGRA